MSKNLKEPKRERASRAVRQNRKTERQGQKAMAISNRIPDQSASESYAQAMERAMLKSQQAGQQVEAVQRIRLVSGCLLYRAAPNLWRSGKSPRQACCIVDSGNMT